MKKILSSFLALTLLAGLIPVSAEGIDFSDVSGHWAYKELNAAVENGLLSGSGELLRPDDRLTRAELATIVVRAFQATKSAPLAGFDDLNTDAWYRDGLSKAVGMGIMQGAGGKLSPDAPVTREAAFVMLERAFCFASELNSPGTPYAHQDENSSSALRFSDRDQISDWALSAVTCLNDLGYLSGNGGALHPQDPITRAEFAVLMNRFVKEYRVAGETETQTEQKIDGSLMLTGTKAATLTDLTVNGNLYLSDDIPSVTFRKVNVEGYLIVRGDTKLTLDDTCSADVLVLNKPNAAADGLKDVTGSGSKKRFNAVYLLNLNDAALSDIQAETLAVASNGSVSFRNCKVTDLAMTGGGDFTVDSGMNTTNQYLMGSGGSLTLNGRTESLSVYADRANVSGKGTVSGTFTLYGYHATGELMDAITSQQDIGLDKAAVTISASSPTLPIDGTVTLTANVAGITPSTMQSKLSYQWYLDGQPIYEGTGAAYTFSLPAWRDMPAGGAFRCQVSYYDKNLQAELYLPYDNYSAEYYDKYDPQKVLELVQPVYHDLTMTTRTTVYANSNMTGAITTLPRGTHCNLILLGGYTAHILLEDGTTGYVNRGTFTISNQDYTIYDWDFDLKQKNIFVNTMGYTSPTDYLVWINIQHQTVNVFTRKDGMWQIEYVAPCSSGRNQTPTDNGIWEYYRRDAIWNFGSYYCKPALRFNNTGEAMHCLPKRWNGSYLEYYMSTPSSHGCIRMLDQDINWVDEHLPLHSTIVVY